MMKLSLVGVLGVLGLASAQPNLRTPSVKINDDTSSVINTSVVYEGIKSEFASMDDMAVIQMSVAAALDEIYGHDSEVEDGMLGICGFICKLVRERNPPKVGPPPPKAPPTVCGAWGCGPNYGRPFIYIESDGRCGARCGGPGGDYGGEIGYGNHHPKRHHILAADAPDTANDEEITSMALVTLEGQIPEIQDLSLRETFDQLVCENMRASGSKALEDVHDCHVYFYALHEPMCTTNEVMIKIDGIVIQSEDDFSKIEFAANSAGLENFTVQVVSSIGDKAAEPKTFVLAEIGHSDNNCNANVDATAHAFCANLHDHGFETAHGCEIAAFGVSMMAQKNAAVDMEVA